MNAQIRDELLALKGDKELLTAAEVVEWARKNKKSALHNAPEFFGWDDKKAAHRAYLDGARRLIVLHLRHDDGTPQVVSLTIDRTRPDGGYRNVDEVVKDETLSEIMLKDALRDLARVQSKYNQVKALKPVWGEVDRIRAKSERKEKDRVAA